jgi:hypothetical protein
MQTITSQATTAVIRFIETGHRYLSPIPNPPTVEQEKLAHVEGEKSAKTTRETYNNLFYEFKTLSFDAEWLNGIQQRIIASVPTEGYPVKGNTAWLDQQVARAALEFFKSTSTVLPGEPYIYSSGAGDLVAEFSALRGKMTCLISSKFVLLYAIAGDEVIEKAFLRGQVNADKLRSEILAVRNLLSETPNASLAAES